jgi:hypothetical protein
MLTLLADTSDPVNAHPAIWTPFMAVGEGGVEGKRWEMGTLRLTVPDPREYPGTKRSDT